MPVASVELLEQLKNKVSARNDAIFKKSVENWLNSSLSTSYRLVEYTVMKFYSDECDKVIAAKRSVLREIDSKNSQALHLFDNDTASRKYQLEVSLKQPYGEPSVRDVSTSAVEDHRDNLLRELERARSEGRNRLVQELNNEYGRIDHIETKEVTRKLAELSAVIQTVKERLKSDQAYMLAQIVNDAFVTKQVQGGLQNICDAVSFFVEQHLWATTDSVLVLDAYAVDRYTAPWHLWCEAVSNVMNSVGSNTWGNVAFSNFDGYVKWAAKVKPLDEEVNAFAQYCQKKIPILSLSDREMTPNLRNYLYAPSQLSALYVNQQRSGIKNFAYTADDRASSIDLCFRRVDWLRVIEAMLPWSPCYSALGQATMSPVLALSLDEVSSYLKNNTVKIIVLNVGTENEPLWTLMRYGTNQLDIFVPTSADNAFAKDLSERIKNQVNCVLNPIKINFVTVNIDQHDIEKQVQTADITGQLWTAVLATRVLPFCLECNTVGKGVTLDRYRHQLPFSVLMESALGSAVIRSSLALPYSWLYKDREEISRRYAQRTFWNSPGTLDQAWSFQKSQLNHIKACLNVDGAGFDNMHYFLAANDAGAMTLQTKKNEEPTWFFSPTKSISGLNPGSQRSVLTQFDFYYAMTVVYQQGIKRFDIDDPKHASWNKHWQDCAKEFTVSTSIKGIRSLVDSYASLMTVAPVSPTLPVLLKYTASCAARNRLMKKHFSQEAITSSTASYQLWGETDQYVLSLLMRADAMKTPQEMESFCHRLTLFLGAQGNKGWIQDYCVDQPAPKDEQENFIWEFAQIAQMGLRGLEVIFNNCPKWNGLKKPLSSLTFDLNGQTTRADEYIDCLTKYAADYNKYKLPWFNLVMPIHVEIELANSMAFLMIELSRHPDAQANKEKNGIYLYNMEHQPVEARIAFLTQLLNKVQSNVITTMITIPQYDLKATVANLKECQAHDLYRQIQNAILNNQRLKRAELVKTNTAQLQYFVSNHSLPNVKEMRDVKNDVVMRPSETEKEYIISGGSYGIQQQLQQAQQQQQQIANKKHVELAKKVDVEEELQIVIYRSKGEELWTKETIDEHGRTYWDQLPETVRSLSGFDAQKATPLKELFSAWVGSEHNAAFVVRYMEPEAAEKIMQFAPTFRYGLYHDNLPPGFFLAKKENDLVLCFDRAKEQNEMNTIAYAAVNGRLTPRQARKIILEEPAQVEATPGGDDRQFEMMPKRLSSNSDQVKAGFWCHLVTPQAPRDEYVQAARAALNESADAATELLDARVQASLQVSAFKSNKKPFASVQVETVMHMQQWASFVKNTSFIEHLFLHDRNNEMLNEKQIKKHLHAFGQITHLYDSLPVKHEQQGSSQFMSLVSEFERTFKKVEYLYIWRDRILTPLSNWSTCLSKREINAMVQSLHILQKKPVHAELWWRLVDRHGATVGPVQYAPLWASFCQLIEYMEGQSLIFSDEFSAQWVKLLLSDSMTINGQILLERMQSVLRRIAHSAMDGDDAKKYQQEVLNHLSEIDWSHDGLFYASRYDALSGFWDTDLVERHFDFSVAEKKSYFPSFDFFQLTENASVEEGIHQEFVSALRYLARHFSNNATHYWNVAKPFFNQYWFNNDKIKALDSSTRTALLRLLMKSFVVGQNRMQDFNADVLNQLIELGLQDKTKQNALQELSLLGSLENAGPRDIVWPVHFENLPQLIKLFTTESGQKFLKNQGVSIEFLRGSEVALNCFKAMDPAQSGTVDELLVQWLEKQDAYPYLMTYPWLILPIVNQSEDSTSEHDALMEVHKRGGKEYARLTKQMHSIDFNGSTYLPSFNDLSAGLTLNSIPQFLQCATTNTHNNGTTMLLFDI